MKNKFKGFTLVELIIVMAIMSILMLAIMNMFKPIREIYVDSTQYEAQRTAQNGVVQYITESVRYSTDLGIYNKDGITSASSAVDNFATAFCKNNSIADKTTGNAVAPYSPAEMTKIKDEIKKYAEVLVIDNSTPHIYGSNIYSGRILRRKFPSTPLAYVPPDEGLVWGASASWRKALGEAYYGSNTFAINVSVTDTTPADGTSDDGMFNISVSSTRNGKRDISNAGKETTITNNVTRGGVLCKNLVSGNTGVTNKGIFDVSKYSGSSATSGTKTYIVFLNKDGRDKVNAEIKAAAATP